MDLQSILYTSLMGALLDCMSLVLHWFAKMSAPKYEHFRAPTQCHTDAFWNYRNMRESENSDLLVPQEQKGTGTIILDTLNHKEPLAAMYSFQLMANMVNKVHTALNQCTVPANMASAPVRGADLNAMNGFEQFGDSTFCYFFIDMQTGSEMPTSKLNSSHTSSSDSNNNADDELSIPSSSFVDKHPALHNLPLERQRSISECSDDSFICFEDDISQGDDVKSDEENDLDITTDYESSSAQGKKVRFNLKPKIHVMHAWDYAYRAARKGDWQVHARDRARFKQRIDRLAAILDPILSSNHRQKVYNDRLLNVQ